MWDPDYLVLYVTPPFKFRLFFPKKERKQSDFLTNEQCGSLSNTRFGHVDDFKNMAHWTLWHWRWLKPSACFSSLSTFCLYSVKYFVRSSLLFCFLVRVYAADSKMCYKITQIHHKNAVVFPNTAPITLKKRLKQDLLLLLGLCRLLARVGSHYNEGAKMTTAATLTNSTEYSKTSWLFFAGDMGWISCCALRATWLLIFL